MRRLSISARLTLFHFLTFVVLTAILVVGMFGIVGVIREEQFRTTVRDCAWVAEAQIVNTGEIPADAMRGGGCDGVSAAGLDANGRVTVAIGDLVSVGDAFPDDLWRDVAAGADNAGRRNSASADGQQHNYAYAIPITAPAGETQFVVASGPYSLIGTVWGFSAPLALAGAGLLVLGVLSILSWFLVRASLRPVAALNASLEHISAQRLAARLPGSHHHDELGRLTHTINRLLGRLDESFAEQARLVETQRRFVADASHELRTPLTSIMGYTKLLREWGMDDRTVAEESLAALESETARMRELVDGLLDLARNDELADVTRTSVDLRNVVREAIDSIDVDRHDAITADHSEVPTVANVDADAVRRLVVILLDNALRHGAPPVEVHLTDAGDAAEIRVRDHGPGIPAEDRERVFERFFRADASRSTPGNGIGLAIAQQIATQHGGSIRLADPGGPGAEFVVTLPHDPL